MKKMIKGLVISYAIFILIGSVNSVSTESNYVCICNSICYDIDYQQPLSASQNTPNDNPCVGVCGSLPVTYEGVGEICASYCSRNPNICSPFGAELDSGESGTFIDKKDEKIGSGACHYNSNCIDVKDETECKTKAGRETYDFKVGESCSLIDANLKAQIDSLNKLGNITPEGLIGKVIYKALTIVGAVALLMFVYGGFVYMTARGNSDKAGDAIKILTWTAMGMVAILSSYVLLKFILDALS